MQGGEGAISGLVKGTNGKGIGGAMVVLNETVGTTTDSNGAFSITNVTAGSYDIVVSKDGYDSVQKKVNVTSGLTSVVSLNIKGTVVRPLISDGSVVFMVIGGLALGIVTLSMFWKRKGRLI